MTGSEIITKLRWLVREGQNVISDEALLKLYNRKRLDFALLTKVSMRIWVCPNPPSFSKTFSAAFERAFSSTFAFNPFFLCTANGWSCSQVWEVQQLRGITGGFTSGGYIVTNPGDAAHVTEQNRIPFPLPEDFGAPLLMLWRGKELLYVTEAELSAYDTDWKIRQASEPLYWTLGDGYEKGLFYLFPYPSYESIASSGEGVMILTDGDLSFSEAGPISYVPTFDPDYDTNEIVSQVLPASECITLFYAVAPIDLDETSDEVIPLPFVQYILAGAAAEVLKSRRAFSNETRRAFFSIRYELGLSQAKRAKQRLSLAVKNIVDSVLQGESRGTRPPLPRLPDHYPRFRLR